MTDEIRKCKKCGIEKLLSKEFFGSQKRNGKIYYHRTCKKCKKEKSLLPKENKKVKIIGLCNKCGIIKPQTIEFFSRIENKDTGILYWLGTCKACEKIRNKQYRADNREYLLEIDRQYHKDHREERAEYDRKNKDHKNELKRIRYNSKTLDERRASARAREEKTHYHRNYKRKRYAGDLCFRLKNNLSSSIRLKLKSNDSDKNGKSILDHLPYSMNELKVHIENLFSHPDNLTHNGEVWMTWENWEVYDAKNWNDNDPGTWMWQLDHIIPHSKFYYTTMEEQSFIDCWALSNLRPYSAKQNNIDGNRR